MTQKRWHKTLGFVGGAVALVALWLIGWTFQNWLVSHQTLQNLDLQLVAVTAHPDQPGHYQVTLRLSNQGEVPVRVEHLQLLLRWERQLIAAQSAQVVPPVDPAGQVIVELALQSNLDPAALPRWQGTGSAVVPGRWTVRAFLKLTLPVFKETVYVRMDRALRPDEVGVEPR